MINTSIWRIVHGTDLAEHRQRPHRRQRDSQHGRRRHNPGESISIRSPLAGGGLAQDVGNWSDCLFIPFNGPGTKSHFKMSAFNIFKPMQLVRSATSKNTDDTIGISRRLQHLARLTKGAAARPATALDIGLPSPCDRTNKNVGAVSPGRTS